MNEEHYELITIGAGSGGVAASRRAASHGAKVAIVEAGRVGGTCVLRGCVPKKLLMYAAQFGDTFAEARGYGWTLPESPHFEMARWQQAKAAETARLEGIYRRLLETAGVTLFEGHARLDGPGRVVVSLPDGRERTLHARHVLVASGGSPVRDSLPGIEHCASSDELLELDHVPARVAIVGSGYVAVEFAGMLARLGAQVAMYFRSELPLRGFDTMQRSAAVAALQAAGVELHAGVLPRRVATVQGGLVLEMGGDRLREFDWVLNATGRRPNSAGLGLETVGVNLAPGGAIAVDDSLRAADGVWAIGDVTDRANLTPVAIAEGRALADSLFGGNQRTVDLARIPSAVFMLPPLASVGPTEDDAVAAGHALKIFETDFRPMKSAFHGGEERTRMKLLVDAHSDRVLAVHMAGHDAPEIVQSLAVALSAGATKADFDRTMALHPTAAEEFVLMREPVRTR
jgi:glutathione reductase (NADPH)